MRSRRLRNDREISPSRSTWRASGSWLTEFGMVKETTGELKDLKQYKSKTLSQVDFRRSFWWLQVLPCFPTSSQWFRDRERQRTVGILIQLRKQGTSKTNGGLKSKETIEINNSSKSQTGKNWTGEKCFTVLFMVRTRSIALNRRHCDEISCDDYSSWYITRKSWLKVFDEFGKSWLKVEDEFVVRIWTTISYSDKN